MSSNTLLYTKIKVIFKQIKQKKILYVVYLFIHVTPQHPYDITSL